MQDGPVPQQIKQLNTAVSILLDAGDKTTPQCIYALQNVFDLLLWAEKKKAQALESILGSEVLSIIMVEYEFKMETLVTGMTMLLGNAKEKGVLSRHLLQKGLGDRLLTCYLQYLSKEDKVEEDEHLHMLGSLLKAYHRHFSQQTYPFFIENEHCLIIELCCKFFNCPEEITRTSVMNILMSILKQPYINELMAISRVGSKISQWCRDMCRLFRNELKDFDQHLLITDQTQSEFILHSINDKIILWEDLSALTPQLFAGHFQAEIVIPLIVGSFNTNGIPLFTLKFALFVVSKLIPTISKLGLLPALGSLLFQDKPVKYEDSQLSTAILPPFKLRKLLRDDPVTEEEEDEPNVFKNLSKFFMNIFRSKDSRFVECSCVLLYHLMHAVKKSPEVCQHFINKLGFGMGGSTINQISLILLGHFTAIHPLQITRIIAGLLIYIQPMKYLEEQIKNQLVHITRTSLQEVLQSIEKHKEVHPYLAELLQYDVKTICSTNWSLEPITKTDAALLLNNHFIENDTLPFYQQIPETVFHVARYQVVKCLILRRLCQRLIDEFQQQKSVENYNQQNRLHEGKYIKPGQFLKLPITVNSYKCKLEDGKISIPSCLLLEDERNILVGFIENMKIRIIINFKYKHCKIETHHKKQKTAAHIDLCRYNSSTQHLQQIKGFTLKHVEVNQYYFSTQKNHFINKQIAVLKDILVRIRNNLPEFNLL